MTLVRYLSGLVRAWTEDRLWEKMQYFRCFPAEPSEVYAAMVRAGFSPEQYRSSRPDLEAGLPSAAWSAKHFVQFMANEVTKPYGFPIGIDFRQLLMLADLNIRDRWFKATLIRSLIQAQIDVDHDCIYAVEFWRQVLDVTTRVGRPLVFIGDSHSLILRQCVWCADEVLLPLNLFCGGGSARGLPNAGSRSQYGVRIQRAIRALEAARRDAERTVPVCLGFGQVDVEFVYTFGRLRRQIDADDDAGFRAFCERTARPYVQWVADLAIADATILGINPPCIDDEHVHEAYGIQIQTYTTAGLVDGAGGPSFADLWSRFGRLQFAAKRDRTERHRFLNGSVARHADALGLRYLDCFDAMIGRDGEIDRRYTRAAGDAMAFQIGKSAKDIHVGGQFAVEVKANLIRAVARSSLRRIIGRIQVVVEFQVVLK